MGFEGLEGGVTDDVLDLAGILCGDGCVDAELGEQLRQDGVPFIDFFSRYTPCVGEMNIVFLSHRKKTTFTQSGGGMSDAGL